MKKTLTIAALVLGIAVCLGSLLIFFSSRKEADKVDRGTASGQESPEPNFKAKSDNPTVEVSGTSGEDGTASTEDREQSSGAINVSEAPQKTETSGQTVQSTKPTNTAKPTKTPKPTNTAKPTKTPKPTNTAKPTKTPKPTNTAKPTKTPKPTTEPKSTDSEQKEGEERPYFKSKEDILITNDN